MPTIHSTFQKSKFITTTCLLLVSLVLPTTGLAIDLDYHFDGLKNDLKENILLHLKHQEKKYHKPLSADDANIIVAKSPSTIKRALQPLGYFHPIIHADVKKTKYRWVLTYNIDPGPSIILTSVDIQITGQGKQHKEFTTLIANSQANMGKTLSVEDYSDLKQRLFTTAENLGYLKAHLTQHRLNINPQTNQAGIILHMDTGPRYQFGELSISPTPYSEAFVSRFFHFKKGDVYQTKTLLNLQRDLTLSSYFQHAAITPQLDAAKGLQVPIAVHLQPSPREKYQASLGYGTDTGIRGSFAWHWRRVTHSGHQFQTIAQGAHVRSTLMANYIIPGKNPANDKIILGTGIENYRSKLGKYRIKKLQASETRGVGHWKRTIKLSFQDEKSYILNQAYRKNRFLIPSINWKRIDSDDPLYTRKGKRIDITLLGAKKELFSDTDFMQANFNFKIIRPLFERSRFIARVNLGATSTNNKGDIPLSMLFKAGGSQSLRGYSFEELGPGLYLATGGIEAQLNIAENWNSLFFYDMGSVFNRYSETKQSLGAGIVYLSAIGPINLAIAKPIEDDRHYWKLHIYMGMEL